MSLLKKEISFSHMTEFSIHMRDAYFKYIEIMRQLWVKKVRVARLDQLGCSGGICTFMEYQHGAGQWKADQRGPEICTYACLFPYISTRPLKLWGGALLDASLWLAASTSDVCSSQIIAYRIISRDSQWHRKFSFLLWRYSGRHSMHVALHGAHEEA